MELAQDTTLTAKFERIPIYHELVLEVNNDLMGVAYGAGRYPDSTKVPIHARGNNTYRFVGWYLIDSEDDEGEIYSTYMHDTVFLTRDIMLKAVFEPIPLSAELAMIYVRGLPVDNFAANNYSYTFRYPAGTEDSQLPTLADVSWDLGDEYQVVEATQSGSTIMLNVTSGRGLTKTYVLSFLIEMPNRFIVTTLSNNAEWGTVIGGGAYDENSIVDIQAVAADGYQFYHWNNIITDNPHSFTLTQDTSFVALFLPNSEENVISDVTSNSVHMEWEVKPWGNHGYWVWIYVDKDHKHWFCKMRFFIDGSLDKFYWGPASRHYAPSEPNQIMPRYIRRAPARYLATPTVIAYDLEELDSSQDYFFTLEGVNETEEVISVQAGTFTTPAQIPTALEDIDATTSVVSQKIMSNGQFYILRGEKVYTLTGQEVK